MLRAVIAGISLLAAYPAAAQTSMDLTGKYGPPTLEQYRLRPDVSLTVVYGTDRAACELRVEPWTTPGEPRTISGAIADQLLNELAPPGSRIGVPLVMFEQMGCSAARMTQYRNVSIFRSTNECVPDKNNNVTSLVISWKRPECGETNHRQD